VTEILKKNFAKLALMQINLFNSFYDTVVLPRISLSEYFAVRLEIFFEIKHNKYVLV